MPSEPFSEDEIEAARKLFAGDIQFVKGVVSMDGLPPAGLAEIAFAGRSNVGKSSLINALTNRKNLARASNTPGRTQELNFFDLGPGKLMLVDLPGYGFADAPKKAAQSWGRVTLDYLRGRQPLKRVILLIDSRRGIGAVDEEILDKLDASAVAYQVVLTKTDKLKKSEVEPTRMAALGALKKRPAAHPRVICTSSETSEGLPELRAELAAFV